MSKNPSDSFEQRPTNAMADGVPAPVKSSKKGCIIGFLIASALGMFVCCGGGAIVTMIGVGIMAEQYEGQLQQNPIVEEHIGQIESFEFSWTGTMSEAQNADEPGTETPIVFEIKGDKGSGTALIVQDKSGNGSGIASATLVMEDGSRHPLDVAEPPSAADDIDLEGMFDSGYPDAGEPSESNDGGASDSDSGEAEAEPNPVAPAETN